MAKQRRLSILLISLATPLQNAYAYDFMQKNECLILRKGKVPVHTTCVSSGGMSNGTLDLSIQTLDGKKYSLYSEVNPKNPDDYIYWLQHKPARSYNDDGRTCYERKDKVLGFCLGEEK